MRVIRQGEVTAAEVRATALLAIDHFNPLVNAVVEIWRDAPPPKRARCTACLFWSKT